MVASTHHKFPETQLVMRSWPRKDFRTLRFWNNEVLGNIEGVLQQLLKVIDKHRELS
jgi:very-short-patch-repair endonuclease